MEIHKPTEKEKGISERGNNNAGMGSTSSNCWKGERKKERQKHTGRRSRRRRRKHKSQRKRWKNR
jgi:hypothetical protein